MNCQSKQKFRLTPVFLNSPNIFQPLYRMFTKEWCGFKNLLNDYVLQLDGAPPHFHRNVQELLNRVLQQRWIGRAANGDNPIHILYGATSIIMWMRVM
jgi:hypothetical protein